MKTMLNSLTLTAGMALFLQCADASRPPSRGNGDE